MHVLIKQQAEGRALSTQLVIWLTSLLLASLLVRVLLALLAILILVVLVILIVLSIRELQKQCALLLDATMEDYQCTILFTIVIIDNANSPRKGSQLRAELTLSRVYKYYRVGINIRVELGNYGFLLQCLNKQLNLVVKGILGYKQILVYLLIAYRARIMEDIYNKRLNRLPIR